jgi:aspartyl-tRNA(Asn)/glutamyl-tRNA(Gln) amidotransferase subunit B
VDAVIEAKGLKQMNDSGALEKIIDEVIAANPDNVAQFRAGKDKAFNALVGQAMKASKGKAATRKQVNDLLRKPAQLVQLLRTSCAPACARRPCRQ